MNPALATSSRGLILPAHGIAPSPRFEHLAERGRVYSYAQVHERAPSASKSATRSERDDNVSDLRLDEFAAELAGDGENVAVGRQRQLEDLDVVRLVESR